MLEVEHRPRRVCRTSGKKMKASKREHFARKALREKWKGIKGE